MERLILIAILLIATPFSGIAQIQTPTDKDRDSVSKQDADVNKTDPNSNTGSGQSSTNYVRPDSKTRFKRYVMGMVGPMALGVDVFRAGWSTWRNSPEEWGDHWDGFGRRVASSFGKSVVSNTVEYSLDESFKLDSHYYRSKDKTVKARIGNALISPVTARDKDGSRVLGFPHLTGVYTAHIVAIESWYPNRYTWRDGLKSGTYSLGLEAAFNLVKEFIRKK